MHDICIFIFESKQYSHIVIEFELFVSKFDEIGLLGTC